MIALYHHHKELNQLQESTDSDSFTSDRFIPIIGLTIFELLSATPLFTFTLVSTITSGFEPWVSWDHVHASYSFIPVYPSVIWRSQSKWATEIQMARWTGSTCGIVLFLFLGTTKQARKHYVAAYTRLTGCFGGGSSMNIGVERYAFIWMCYHCSMTILYIAQEIRNTI